MRTTIRKLYWIWQFDEEEQWLNDMAAQGKALVSARYLTYEFEDSAPGEYAIRLEALEHHPTTPESRQYISFVEEMGAEYLGRVNYWVYFRRKREDGEFELHDNAICLKHMLRCLRLVLALAIFNGAVGMFNLCIGVGLGSLLNLLCACLSAALTALLVRGALLLHAKKRQLEKDSRLFE